MAKCNLRVELTDPDRVYQPGDKVTGVIRVDVDADVNCKGLEIQSGWKTNGKGNVSSGKADSITPFTGMWKTGDQEAYPFELPVADWPPTYHGTYLNIEHAIDARAKIAWAFDPKASTTYEMRPVAAPDSLDVSAKPKKVGGVLGCFLAGIFGTMITVPLILVLVNPIIAMVVALVASVVGLFYFVKKVMPRLVLGDVEFKLDSTRVSPGDTTRGTLRMMPRRAVEITSITVELRGREVCVSGSGSNRTTHTHELMKHTLTIVDSMRIEPGQKTELPIEMPIPDTDAFSCDLGDNKIVWSASFRVDIPRWPDYYETIPVEVVPSGEVETLVNTEASVPDSQPAETGPVDITFAETAGHFLALMEDDDQAESLADAVSGLTFPIEAFVERRLLYSGDDDPHVYEDGYAVWAHYSEPRLPMVLYIPHDLADEFEQAGRDLWQGRGTIVGWDREHQRLQVKVVQG